MDICDQQLLQHQIHELDQDLTAGGECQQHAAADQEAKGFSTAPGMAAQVHNLIGASPFAPDLARQRFCYARALSGECSGLMELWRATYHACNLLNDGPTQNPELLCSCLHPWFMY
jgi:hypothetical protein